jgi:hypothetical protein
MTLRSLALNTDNPSMTMLQNTSLVVSLFVALSACSANGGSSLSTDDISRATEAAVDLPAPFEDIDDASDVRDAPTDQGLPYDVPTSPDDRPAPIDVRDVALDVPVDSPTSSDVSAGCMLLASSSSVGDRVFSGTTIGAPNRRRSSACLQGGPEVTVAWTAPETGYYRIDHFRASRLDARFDPVLSIALSCGGEEVACNDDAVQNEASVTMQVTAGQTLYLTLDGASRDSAGAFVVNITRTPMPSCNVPGSTCQFRDGAWEYGYLRGPTESCMAPFVDHPSQLFDVEDIQRGAVTCACRCGTPAGSCQTDVVCNSGVTCGPGRPRTIGRSCSTDSFFVRDADFACTAAPPRPAGAGTCERSVQETSRVAPSWAPRQRFCVAPAGASQCQPWGGSFCQPRVPAGRQTCIAQRTTGRCPLHYTRQLRFVTAPSDGNLRDNRRCEAGSCGCANSAITRCDCDPSTGCFVGFYTSNFCSPDARVVRISATNACSTFRYLGIRAANADFSGAIPVIEPCAPTGAPTVSGDVFPNNQLDITVCCKTED